MSFDTRRQYRRIVSLVPSQTEYIIDLIGTDTSHQVVGRTKFCVHPQDKVKGILRVGGTKQVDVDKVRNLAPDIIIINKEENTKEIQKELRDICPTFTTEVKNLADAFSSMNDIAHLLQFDAKGKQIIEHIKSNISIPHTFKHATYLIWKDPYMTIGGDTFINDMMSRAGFINAFSDHERYPIVTFEDILKEDPDYIFLSSEPYPFKEQHIEEFQSLDIPVKIVDGEMFSWYGSRLLKSWLYFEKLRSEL